MIRILPAAAARSVAALSLAALSLAALAGAAQAQTWGQPVYVGPNGRVIGGTPLSEVETRSHVTTGRWADGYADQPYVHVPGYRGDRYGSGYGYGDRYGDRYGRDRYGYGYRRPEAGYRDEWGYDDDRPPTGRRGYVGRGPDRGCDCPDVYLYDR